MLSPKFSSISTLNVENKLYNDLKSYSSMKYQFPICASPNDVVTAVNDMQPEGKCETSIDIRVSDFTDPKV